MSDPQRAIGDMHQMQMALLALPIGNDHIGDLL